MFKNSPKTGPKRQYKYITEENSITFFQQKNICQRSEVPSPKISKKIITYLPKQSERDITFVCQNTDTAIEEKDSQSITPQIWYYSNNICSMIEMKEYFFDNKESNIQQFFIETAVAGGNLYRLILGGDQPQMYTCRNEETFYRVSQSINFTNWYNCWSENKEGELLFLGHKFKEKMNRVNSPFGEKPIVGLVAILIVACLLADGDMHVTNFGFVEHDDHFNAVKIDPECCFQEEFFEQDVDDIFNDIKLLRCQSVTSNLEMAFDGTELSSPINNIKNIESMMDLIDSPRNKHEKFLTLAKIFTVPLEKYLDVLHSSFSESFSEQRDRYTTNFALRLTKFRKAASKLRGFDSFFNEYLYKKFQNNDNDTRLYSPIPQTQVNIKL